MKTIPNFGYAKNWRGLISNRMRRHQGAARLKMAKAAAVYLKELEEVLRQASLYLVNNADPNLQAEVQAGNEYLRQLKPQSFA